MAGSAFKNADVIKALSGYTPILVDGDTEKDVTAKYGVHGYPALVFADAKGEEIDRIVGYEPEPAFLADVARIARGEGTLPGLRKAFADAPDDVDAGIALGARLAGSRPDEAAALFASLAEKAQAKDRATQGKVALEYAAALLSAGKRDLAVTTAEALVRDFADTPAAGAAATRVGRAFLGLDVSRALAFFAAVRDVATEPTDKSAVENFTIAVHKNGIAAALKRQAAAAGEDAQALNAVAWTCFEQKLNIREALGWARTAVAKSDRDPMILDTLANLLWLTGARDEALKTEEEAAGKVEGKMKRDFDALVSKWRAEIESLKAANSVPATPLVPLAEKPKDGGAK